MQTRSSFPYTGNRSNRRKENSISAESIGLSAGCGDQGLRAIPLWFGTYKNGAMDYVPDWIKTDTKRFPRVLDYGGRPIRVLSPHGQATLEADRRAYGELMKHLKEIDAKDQTVILMQVENESGLLGSVRDYSPEATRLFNGRGSGCAGQGP